MGVSTNAYLRYGYCWLDEIELADDWVAVIAKQRGLVNLWDSYVEPAKSTYEQRRRHEDEWTKAHRTELDAYYDANRAIEVEYGVELGRHCSGECSMPMLFIPGVGSTAYRGCPVLFRTWPDTQPEWKAKLDKWLADMDVEKPQAEPNWWLASYWG